MDRGREGWEGEGGDRIEGGMGGERGRRGGSGGEEEGGVEREKEGVKEAED